MINGETSAVPGEARDFQAPKYSLEANQEFLGFQRGEPTKKEKKPWGAEEPVEFRFTKADGSVAEGVDANLPFFTFVDGEGRKLTVSAGAAEHIDRLHIKGEDVGSKFDEPSLEALMRDAAAKMPGDVAKQPGVSAFAIDMGKSMGKEGVSSMKELVAAGVLSESDVETAQRAKDTVRELNRKGDNVAKETFIAKFRQENPGCKIQFQLVRGEVLVPTVDAPKRDTHELFMVFGPGATGDKTMYTAAPGRFMPRHPKVSDHASREGVVNEDTFAESADAWFDTVMLTGK